VQVSSFAFAGIDTDFSAGEATGGGCCGGGCGSCGCGSSSALN
jgi:hypothetical protein